MKVKNVKIGIFAVKYPNVILDHKTVKSRVNIQRLFSERNCKQVNKGGNPEYLQY